MQQEDKDGVFLNTKEDVVLESSSNYCLALPLESIFLPSPPRQSPTEPKKHLEKFNLGKNTATLPTI
jgi:hypothetical protein